MKTDELTKPNTQTTKEVKSKILSRIQEQLNRQEGDAMDYLKVDIHDKQNQYMKGPVPILPIAE
jgi:hypothetical protein